LPLEQHLKIEKKNIVWFFASDGSRRSEFVFQISDVVSFGCIPTRDLTVNGETSVFFSKKFMLLQKWQ
jgi:hypothetical protein